MAGGWGPWPHQFFKNVGFSDTLMLRRKMFRLLLLVKTKVSNSVGKSLNLAPALQVPNSMIFNVVQQRREKYLAPALQVPNTFLASAVQHSPRKDN